MAFFIQMNRNHRDLLQGLGAFLLHDDTQESSPIVDTDFWLLDDEQAYVLQERLSTNSTQGRLFILNRTSETASQVWNTICTQRYCPGQ
jgi:hypothetical protein